MRLCSGRGRKAKCSTTCKRFLTMFWGNGFHRAARVSFASEGIAALVLFAFAGLTALTFFVSTGVTARAESMSAYTEDTETIEETEIIENMEATGNTVLLLYDLDKSTDAAYLVEAVTKAGQSLYYTAAGTFEGDPGDYEYVICLGVDRKEGALLERLKDFDGELLFLGSDMVNELCPGICLSEERQKGTLEYEAGDAFQEILDYYRMELSEEPEYENGTILGRGAVCPFFVESGKITCCPAAEYSSELVRMALFYELSHWMGVDLGEYAGAYLVIDEVYAFMPADELLERIGLCMEAKVPFLISVMPVWQNSDYPAMRQFCDVLNYAASNGALILLHDPILRSKSEDSSSVLSQMETAVRTYEELGVSIAGVEVPESWIFEEGYMEAAATYPIVVTYADDLTVQEDLHCNQVLSFDSLLVYPAETSEISDSIQNVGYRSAWYLDAQTDLAEFQMRLELFARSGADIGDLAAEENLTVSSVSYEPVGWDEDYDYHRNVLDRAVYNLENQNHVLMAAVCVFVIIFISFILYARSTMRRNLLTGRPGRGDGKKKNHMDRGEDK